MQKITACELLSLAFLEYCFSSGRGEDRGKNCRFTYDDETIHRNIHQLQSEFSNDLPLLKHWLFETMGAFPYSSGLWEDLWIITSSGLLVAVHTSNDESWLEKHISSDSAEYLAEWIEEVFLNDPDRLKIFRIFSEKLGKALSLPSR